MKIDIRAKKILFDMHWSSSGWKVPAETPNELDFEYAKSKGYLFEDQTLSHRSAISLIRKSVKKSDISKLTNLYVSSLSERALHIRPGLPAYFESEKFNKHWFSPDQNNICAVCKMFKRNETRLNSWNFSRYKWGSYSRHFAPLCNSFILEELNREPSRKPKKEDWVILKNLLRVLFEKNQKTKASDVIDLWKGVVPSNRQEREILFESFISMKIITPSRTTQNDYDNIPRKSNWSDEAALWRGDNKPNKTLISEIFGENAIA